MILDTLENAGRYHGLHRAFKQAFAFLMRRDLKDLPPGRHEIDGARVFALVSKGPGRKKQDAKIEVHEKHVDIQYILSGTDEMGWKPKSSCTAPAGPYDPEKDIRFFSDEPDAWVVVRPGAFAIFFPEDAHLPLVSAGEVHKVVVKVAL
jgi:YhcH/YjgK/YiaL family protein